MKKHLDLAQERRMDSCVILGNCIVQYSSKTPYLIVSGGLLAAEDRKMEDLEEA